jgi:hypothetical protein
MNEYTIEKLEELRDEIESVLLRLNNAMDDFRDLQEEINSLNGADVEKIFESYISAGLIPGAYFRINGDKHNNLYQIVAIRDRQYAAVNIKEPDKKINMPLYLDGKFFIERFILVDEKEAEKLKEVDAK